MLKFASLNARNQAHLGEGLREMYADLGDLRDLPDGIADRLAELMAAMCPSPCHDAEPTEPGLDFELAA